MTPEQCIANGERILALATLNLDRIATEMAGAGPVPGADAIAFADAQTRLGCAWAGLGEIKALVRPFEGIDP